jgi:hypothetical protein
MKLGSEELAAGTGESVLPGVMATGAVVVQAAASGANMAIAKKRAPVRTRPYIMVYLIRSAG